VINFGGEGFVPAIHERKGKRGNGEYCYTERLFNRCSNHCNCQRIFQWKQAFYGIKLAYSLRRQKKDPVGYIRIIRRWPKRANERGKFSV